MTKISKIKAKLLFILETKHKLGRVCSFEEYSKFHTSDCFYGLIESNRETFVCPANYIGGKFEKPYKVSLPDLYYCKLKNASVIGESSVVVSEGGAILYDMLAEREKYGANMTDHGLCLIGGRPRHFGENFIYNYLYGGMSCLNNGISLACNMSNNYYHFMFDVASRFYLLSKIDIPKEVPLIVDEGVLNTPQMLEIVEVLNVEHRKIIPIRKCSMCVVRELYILSKPHVLTPNFENIQFCLTEAFAFDANALSFVRDSLIAGLSGDEISCGEVIFLSRKNCNKRKCNEDDLETTLQKYSAEIVCSEKMTIGNQIRKFYSARLIIGGSGAAFTNLLFVKKNSTAIIFTPSRINVSCFSSLAAALNINTIYIADTHSRKSIHAESYCVESTVLDKVISNIIPNNV